MSKHTQEHVYPEEIQKYEKELIDFIIGSGKNKRKSEIESHILGYFLLHPSLTQEQIQDLSGIYRQKKISSGAISNFLNLYLSYEPKIIEKEKVEGSKNKFRYHVISDKIASIFSISQEVGVTLLLDNIKKLNEIMFSLNAIVPSDNESDLGKVLMNRSRELRDYFIYHLSLLDKFMAGDTRNKLAPIQKELIKLYEIPTIETQMKYDSYEHVEQEIINFISKSTLFVFEEMKYQPIIAYLITRKKLTQSQLQELTGVSSGLISEGLKFLTEKGYIRIEKIKGIRQRKYVLPSIGYFNMLKFYNRFRHIALNKQRLNDILFELNEKKTELRGLNGYMIIKNRVSEFLKLFNVVDKAMLLFKEAMNDFSFSN